MIRLLKTTDDKRKLNKTYTVVKDNIKYNKMDRTDIISPTYNVEYFDTIYNANYLYDNTTNRYYYINNIEMESGGRCSLYCDVDVLMSHSAQIKQITATVDRNEKTKNGYLVDNKYKTYAYEQIVCKRFPNAMNNDSIILMTIG